MTLHPPQQADGSRGGVVVNTARAEPPPAHTSGNQLDTEAALRVVIETALTAVVTMDQDGLVTGWSGRATDMFGWSTDDVLGQPVADLIVPPAYRDAHRRGLAHYRRTGDGPVLGQVLELSALHQDGHEFPVELRISPAVRTDAHTTFIAFIADITERKRSADELASLYADACSVKETMASLINTIAHEVRSPLLVLAAYVELLRSGSYGAVPERWDDPLRLIQSKAEEISQLVDRLVATTTRPDPRSADQ